MAKHADLHIHTHYSDSTSPPEEVIEHAYHSGLSCIAITDHDVVDGIDPTIEAAKKYDIEVIPGIELSTEVNGKDVHVLGYLFDYKNEELKEKLTFIQNARVERIQSMIEKLKGLGIDNIELEEVCALTESNAVGRPHLAAIMKQKGVVSNEREAFNKYIDDDGPAYVHKFKQTPEEAISLIHRLGGVAVLAHPMITNVDELIPSLVRSGLDGLEAYYSNVNEKVVNYYLGLAKKNNLVVTGGSDAHGDAKKHTWVGKRNIPYELVEALKDRARKVRQ